MSFTLPPVSSPVSVALPVPTPSDTTASATTIPPSISVTISPLNNAGTLHGTRISILRPGFPLMTLTIAMLAQPVIAAANTAV